jgi:hypothetical protein
MCFYMSTTKFNIWKIKKKSIRRTFVLFFSRYITLYDYSSWCGRFDTFCICNYVLITTYVAIILKNLLFPLSAKDIENIFSS